MSFKIFLYTFILTYFIQTGYDKVKGKVVSQPSMSVKHISGSNIIGNHSVNLLSSMLTCLVAPHIHIMIND